MSKTKIFNVIMYKKQVINLYINTIVIKDFLLYNLCEERGRCNFCFFIQNEWFYEKVNFLIFSCSFILIGYDF